MTHFTLTYNLLLLLAVVGGWRLLRLLKRRLPAWLALLAAGGAVAAGGLLGMLWNPLGPFGLLQLAAWLGFVHAPLFLGGAAVLLRNPRRWLARLCGATAVLILLIGLDAFVIEPRWLAVTYHTLPAPGLDAPVRLALVADLQTDRPGPYEAYALEQVRQANPDLILFAGDYLHILDPAAYVVEIGALNELLRAAALEPPLGAYAVRGNVDRAGFWPVIFAGLPVTTVETTTTVDVGPLALTLLSLEDAFDTAVVVPPQPQYHVVLGHSPNFSLGDVQADLLLAGHTHGGQVRLPFIGPLLTLSEVPRAWAAGLTAIAPGQTLIVSRGVGLERGYAPRVRFLCRPEIVIVDLMPGG
jgi:uncharacterized protein